ncbi:MAG: amidinotransferase [Bacteroidetes bacterium]|nr:MAG: amidinotransferase [Bacteroidota bacterium]MBL1144311.1 amidinotransferase [Bacteroidota bacterium]NOG57107.1 amidinotransferase [Bacteroidota bacterium]
MPFAKTILMIHPENFGFNVETAKSNAFQQQSKLNVDEIQAKAKLEFTNMAKVLMNHGVTVLSFQDTENPIKPDAIFPNNWVSFHDDGKVVLYPMEAKNRRLERRLDIIEALSEVYEVKEIIDLSYFESENKFLEGTGSMILDRVNKIAYACLSPRTHIEPFLEFCNKLGYKPAYFNAADENNKAIYHTNVMMSVGEFFAVVCLDAIQDANQREYLVRMLKKTHHTVIDISIKQMKSFAGNILQVKGKDACLIMSTTAFDCLTTDQLDEISDYVEIIPIDIPTIEQIGGGGVRCMMAEVFLRLKEAANN